MDLGEELHELVRGEVVAVPRSMPIHGLHCGHALLTLESFGRRTGFGYALSNNSAVVTERDPDTVRGPDVVFYSQARWPREKLGWSLVPVPPDLVVEVLSPCERPREVRQKISEYLAVGVLMVWIIEPEKRRLLIYRPDELAPTIDAENDVVENLAELPGFRCVVSEFFA